MRAKRVAGTIAVAGLIAVVSGCAASEPEAQGTDESPAPADGVAELLRSSELAFQWDGGVHTTTAIPWSPEEVSASVPIGERLHPAWSPDGTQLAFAGEGAGGTRVIWVADVANGRAVLTADCVAPCAWVDDPTWSPDGERIGFVQGETDASGAGVGTIRSVTVDGDDEIVHFTAAPTEYPFAIDWSPDGDSFAAELVRFSSTDIADEDVTGNAVAVIGLDGRAELVTDYRDGLGYPSWSPDGRWILVSDPDLWAIDLSTMDRHSLTRAVDDGGRALQGSYSPDGRAVVYVLEQPLGAAPVVAAIPTGGGAALELGEGTHPQVRP